MSNIFAAIGRVQLQRLDIEFAPRRKELASAYRNLLANNPLIKMQGVADNSDIVPHIFIIRVLDGKREGLKNKLEEEKIPTGIHYKPNHLLSFYGNRSVKLPVTENVYNEILTLPLHPELEISDIEEICAIINNYLIK
jgi:dTDP-4-amino-4,6-dideoxygalactose transaminase